MRILSLATLLAASVLGAPTVGAAASTHSMMVAPNDLPGQDLSSIGVLHMDDMSSMANPPYDDGKGLVALAPTTARVSPAAAQAPPAPPSIPGTGYVLGPERAPGSEVISTRR